MPATRRHFGAHAFEAPHADDRPRPCRVPGCPVVREGRRIDEGPRVPRFAENEAAHPEPTGRTGPR